MPCRQGQWIIIHLLKRHAQLALWIIIHTRQTQWIIIHLLCNLLFFYTSSHSSSGADTRHQSSTWLPVKTHSEGATTSHYRSRRTLTELLLFQDL